MKSLEISNEQSLPYKFLLKKHNTVFYNSLILLTLYKSNQQKLKIYNIITIKFSALDKWITSTDVARRYADFAKPPNCYVQVLSKTNGTKITRKNKCCN